MTNGGPWGTRSRAQRVLDHVLMSRYAVCQVAVGPEGSEEKVVFRVALKPKPNRDTQLRSTTARPLPHDTSDKLRTKFADDRVIREGDFVAEDNSWQSLEQHCLSLDVARHWKAGDATAHGFKEFAVCLLIVC